MSMEYRRDVDGLRAVAVLSVVLYHAFGAPLRGGFVGVDIFFVISGFIITSIITREFADGRFSLVDFWERRVRRILPPLFLVIIASIALGIWLYLPSDLEILGVSGIWSLLFLANFFFLIEIDYFAAPEDSYPFLHLWSLAVEEQFYIILPVVFLLCFRMGIKRLFGIIALLSFLSFVSAIAIVELYPKAAFYLLPARFWELGVGVMLALLKHEHLKGFWAHMLGLLGGSLIAFSLLYYSEQTPFPGVAALPPVLGAALVIWAGPQSVIGQVLSLRPLVAIGLVSYGFYLWHWPLLAFYRYTAMDDVNAVGLGAIVMLSLVLSVLSYRYVEQPIRRRQSIFKGRNRIFALMGSVAIVLGALGAVLTQSNGFPGRWQSDALAQLTAGNQSEYGRRSDCHAVEGLDGQFICGVGPIEGAIDFVVWGDSHTISMQAAFAKFADKTGQRGVLAGRSACLGLLGARHTRMPVWHDCPGNNDRVFSYIAKVQPETVILVSRWTNAPYFEFLGDQRTRSWLANSLPYFRHDDLSIGVDKTVQALRDAGIERIAWMRTVPEQNHDIPRLMARSFQWQRALPQAPDLESHLERQRGVEDLFAQHENLILISPDAKICPDALCLFKSDNVPLYDDNHHIARVASEALWSIILNDLGVRASE